MELPPNTDQTAKTIVEKLLVSMGYPKNILPLNIENLSMTGAKTQASFPMGEFNIQTGKLTFNRQAIQRIDTPTLVAILAHELDHFDKAIKVARGVGVSRYVTIFPQRSASDSVFWTKNIQYANINNFDVQKYYNAIYRQANQLDMDLVSSYADFFRFSEPMRNPLELSAYAVSDRILIYYYGKPQNRGDMAKISSIFNNIDNALQTKAKSKPYLKNCVPALFDYYYRVAGLKLFPQYQSAYDYCNRNKKGDLTEFWIKFENNISDFYHQGKMSAETTSKVYQLLSGTLKETSAQLTNDQINEIFKQKIMTMSSNLYSSKALTYMTGLTNDYITFLTQTGTKDSTGELNVLIASICAENGVFTDNRDKVTSVNALKIRPLYKQRLYMNPEFLNQSKRFSSKEEYLVYLVKSSALTRRKN
ncbi:hypothetical protein IKQ26_09695 [bacterium]|nr:hypothetical protein [bacterium]